MTKRVFCHISHIQDKAKLEDEADFWHWGKLEELFSELKDNNTWWTRRMSSMKTIISQLPASSHIMPTIPDIFPSFSPSHWTGLTGLLEFPTNKGHMVGQQNV